LSYTTPDGTWGTEFVQGASCSITITSVPAKAGDHLAFTLKATVVDDDGKAVVLADGQGSVPLR
jgi:hypothetical protein